MAEEIIKTPITDEIATADKDIDLFGGYISVLENPDPTLRTEASGKGLKLYDEVDRDPHAGSVLQTRYLAVVGKDWDVIPAGGMKKTRQAAYDQKVADVVKEILKNTNFEQALQELLQAVLYGFFVAEVIWKLDGGLVKISKIRAKHPKRFSFTYDRNLKLLTPENMVEGVDVPARKFMVFTYGSSDNPYGKGLGQKLWWPVWFKKHGIKFWLVFLEKFGMPTAVGKYPPGTPKEQQQALLNAIDAIHNETGVKIPDTMAIDLLEASRSGNVTYESLCEYMDRQVSKAVLGQTLTTEVGENGSYAASKTHEDVRQDIIEADAGVLAELINETLVPWIVDYNFPNVTAYPQFIIRTEEQDDQKPLAERDKILVRDVGLPVGMNYFYDTYGIPKPENDEELVNTGKQKEEKEEGRAQFSEKGESPAAADQQAVDELVDSVLEQAGSKSEKIRDALRLAVERSESFEDVQIMLAELIDDQADVKELSDLAAETMLAGNMWGRYAAS